MVKNEQVHIQNFITLDEENLSMFQGSLKKIHIVSNKIYYTTKPQLDEEVKQRLTIDDEGCVWLSGYHYGDIENYKKSRSRNFKIKKAYTRKLFAAIEGYFSEENDKIIASDIGYWIMELTNTEGVTYEFRGSLYEDLSYEGIDLSVLVRQTLDMEDLYVFDGNYITDMVNRIT